MKVMEQFINSDWYTWKTSSPSLVILPLSIKSTPGRPGDHGWPLKSIPLPCPCCCFPPLLFLVAGTISLPRRCKSIKYKKDKKRHRHQAPVIHLSAGFSPLWVELWPFIQYSEQCGVATQEKEQERSQHVNKGPLKHYNHGCVLIARDKRVQRKTLAASDKSVRPHKKG